MIPSRFLETPKPFSSLTQAQAIEQLRRIGLNELPQSKKGGFLNRVFRLLREPMLLLLIASASIYIMLGDLSEGILLGTSVFVVIGITWYQEQKSEKALAALKELSSPRALVFRDGVEKRISATELVPGDLIVLHEGDRVPADGIVLQEANLNIDESLLTGESFPVKKCAIHTDTSTLSFDHLEATKKVASSTLVISGTALIRVMKTGVQTEVGKIGKSLQEIKPEETSLAKEIRQIVRMFFWTGSVICLLIIVLYGLTHGQWMQAFLVGLATQMALLPEEFPVVLTIFLAMGAWRLSKVQVLVRNPGSIERLGAITVLCVDKTGTLTQNQMSVAALNNGTKTTLLNKNTIETLDEDFHEVAEIGVLASHRDAFDPMEKAIRRIVEENKWGQEHLHKDWELIRDYPLSDQLLAMSCAWKSPHDHTYTIATKGAPEAIADLCHLDQTKTAYVLGMAKEMAKQGLRVLGVARATTTGEPLPKHQHDFQFNWVGLIGLEDPLRAEVPAAIKRCRKAGIRIMMMTGDYAETALKIADHAGIDTQKSLITGTELNTLTDQELSNRLKSAHVFARMIPEQKLRIVKLLKEQGHIVAMTGDGVNDAPSLKWADIGIAMGGRGTDVAREASDIVLLDDNIQSIVSGIERGRMIFSNIKKAMSYIISIHVPIAGLSILPVLLGWPLILLPVHIVFLELIIDPACSLMFESQDAVETTMNTPPRSLNDRLFSGRDFLKSFLQGILVLAVSALTLWYSLFIKKTDPDHARSFAFAVLAMNNIGLIFANMSDGSIRQIKYLFKKTSNKLIVTGILALLLLLIQNEKIRPLFHFGPLDTLEHLAALALATAVFIFISIWNQLNNRHSRIKQSSHQPF